jgi:HNH endonuclease
VAFTRFNVFLRDRFRCQYCGGQYLRGELTFDHVLPRADGGQTAWTNIVAACSSCNTRKDRRHLKPRRMPFEPAQHELMAAQRLFPLRFLHEIWQDYLYWRGRLRAAFRSTVMQLFCRQPCPAHEGGSIEMALGSAL